MGSVCITFALSVAMIVVGFSPVSTVYAAGTPPPPGLRLQTSPQLVDVGQDESFTLSARSWPGPASATLSFVSPHHGFTGQMVWEGQCSCFKLAVSLARRIHPLEQARAKAIVVSRGRRSLAFATFTIRGLAPNGRGYAPGGKPSLAGWVSDPNPTAREFEHYCAWVTTADGLGVSGMPVRFVVHYSGRSREWNAGTTPSSGIVCVHKQLSDTKAGVKVKVDIHAGALLTSTAFVVR